MKKMHLHQFQSKPNNENHPYPLIEITAEFEKALNLLENSSSHLFITGKAGTGKSTLLELFRNNTSKQVVVLAPTGVAALNVKGQTIHSFFRFRPDITLDKVEKLQSDLIDIYQQVDTIIIDEISMVRADLLDCVDRFLRLNCKKKEKPFGGKQMVFIGDLYQLPPVIKRGEKDIFKNKYKTGYFFSAQAINDLPLTLIELDKIFRQKDEKFIEILNAIRNGTVNDGHLNTLNTRFNPDYEPSSDDFCISLTTRNSTANKINQEQLEKISGTLYCFDSLIEGNFESQNFPTEEIIGLKEGAQVMLLNNDPFGRWVNGSVGKVVQCNQAKENESSSVIVELTDGDLVKVEPYTWEIFEYQYDEGDSLIKTQTLGSFTQLPLRLAWAITIHKSQGKTFDRIVLDLERGAFSPGQVYVALSRCTSLTGIVLKQPIQKKHIFADWKVADFLTRFQYQLSDEKMPLEEKLRFLQEAIEAKKKLEIIYLKTNDEKSKRIIEPFYLGELDYQGKKFFGLEAYCFKRKELRHFRVDRILEMKEVE
ncbi:MAG: ATP-dependent RecD-like DNA helicase [Candidatus Atribacteria bacterium ADurb.Bin276]|uniref:ATP-dependent RecD-like DNA helicase n=2 Tax=Atribacter TaxID=2847777 RepID=A0A1V5SZU8_9BACT|nr:MAG: ATP-dependent RecD-like DNA helicase [Candidatus Atribacteria bacterium ADurb.Bin276]